MNQPKIDEDYLTKGSFLDIYNEEDYFLSNYLIKDELVEKQTISHPMIEQTLF